MIEALALLAAFFSGAAFSDWSWRREMRRWAAKNRGPSS